jgi:hypothetical protein
VSLGSMKQLSRKEGQNWVQKIITKLVPPGVAETVARGISLTVRPTTSLTALLLPLHVVD